MMDWIECNQKKFVKEINVNINLINSLIKSSEKRLELINRLLLDDVTAATKF